MSVNRNRRRYIKNALAATGLAAANPLLSYKPAMAQEFAQPCYISIYMGSSCGWATSLFQPTDPNQYPFGVFEKGAQAESTNPNMNRLFQDGNFIWHTYSKMLTEISDDIAIGVCNPRALGHGAGLAYQSRGDRRNPSFGAGFAQAVVGNSGQVGLVSSDQFISSKNGTTPNVAEIFTRNLTGIVGQYQERNFIKKEDQFRELWSAYEDATKIDHGMATEIGPGLTKSLSTFEKNLFYGAPDAVRPNSPLDIEAREAINLDTINALIDKHIGDDFDGVAVKQRARDSYTNFIAAIQAAAVLAQSGLARSIAIRAPFGGDCHNGDEERGSSHGTTARDGAIVHANIVLLWKLLRKNGYQNTTLIELFNEFGRTPWNRARKTGIESVNFQGNNVPIISAGTDHGPAAGKMFVNGNLTGKVRMGGVGDNFGVFGSQDGSGIVDPNIPAYVSSDLVGSVFGKVFRQYFSTPQGVFDQGMIRHFWKDFSTQIEYL